VPIDFGELSEVIVFGQTKQDYYNDRETGKREKAGIRIDAYGIWPVPGLTTPKDASEAEEIDESEVEGWLE